MAVQTMPQQQSTLSSILPLLMSSGNSTQTSTTTKNGLGSDVYAQIASLINNPGLSKDAAISDSNAAVSAAIKKVVQDNMPQLNDALKSTGGYSSTTNQLLQDNLAAQAAQAGAGLQLAQINSYLNQNANQSLQAAQTLASANNTTTQTTQTNNASPAASTLGTDTMTALLGTLGTAAAVGAGKLAYGAASDYLSAPAMYADGTTAILNDSGAAVSNGDQLLSGIGSAMGCFITTAVCQYLGKPDDCHELTALRAFRDSYMQETEERKALVAQYYEIAPKYVAALKAKKPHIKEPIYVYIYNIYIIPAVRWIDEGKVDLAFKAYCNLMEYMRQMHFVLTAEEE